MGNTMNLEQAIKLVEQVCAQFQGNLQAHQNIQAALDFIRKELESMQDNQKTDIKKSK